MGRKICLKNLKKISKMKKVSPKIKVVPPNRKRKFGTGSISESLKPRKIGKNVKGLKIVIRPGSLKTPTPTKPCTRCYQKAESAPAHRFESGLHGRASDFEFYFNSVFNNHEETMLDSSKTNELIKQQSANFSELVQKLPNSIKTTDESMTTTGLCTLFSSIL